MAKNWYVIQSKSNKETALYQALEKQHHDVFFPRIRVRPVNPRARKERPYFPGYMFIQVDFSVTGTGVFQFMPFARGLLCYGDEPAVVPEQLIAAIHFKIDEINKTGGTQQVIFHKGDQVIIRDSVFEGYKAIFDASVSGKDRVRILIELLGKRQLPVVMDISHLEAPKKNLPG